jgi:nucleoid-associated protein YgaU
MIQNEQMITKYKGYKADERTYKAKKPTKGIHVRIMLLTCIAMLFFILGAFGIGQFGDQDAFAASESVSLEQKSVVVEQGDTLWSIAAVHVKNGQDIRDYVYELKKVNGLKSSTLHSGQKLLVP